MAVPGGVADRTSSGDKENACAKAAIPTNLCSIIESGE
jgi:hypothetical protein